MRRLFFLSLVFGVVVFLSELFFANNVLAVDCLGVGERCILIIEPGPGCGGDKPIGTCGLNGEKTCCKGSGPPADARDCVADGGSCDPSGSCTSGSPSPSRSGCGSGMCCMPVGDPPGPGGPPGTGAPTGPECPGRWQAGICFPGGTGLSSAPVYEILYKLVWWLLAIVGFIGIIAFTISGMQYLLSAGNEEMAKTAKNSMKYSIIGMVVALSGLVIIFFIHDMLAGELVLFFNIGF